MREAAGAGHLAGQEVVVAHLGSNGLLRRWGWLPAVFLALACTSKPIGEQTGAGGASGRAGSGGASGTSGSGAGGAGMPGAGGASSAGGSPGSGGTSTGADAASDGSSGADAASGMDAASESDGARTTDAGSCPASFTAALVKDCTTAADCVLVRHNDCCGGVITAIRAGSDASFSAAEQAFQSCVPGCNVRGCFHADFAENQQSITGATNEAFAAQCVNGRCTSVVTTGSNCAVDGDCGTGEICVAFITNLGPTSTTALSCRGNPCRTSAVSCACAGSICTGFFAGQCSFNAARLSCNDGRQ
jgi:hypothetical protein